jgi:NDP-sugar pyrophosphorylase family protein
MQAVILAGGLGRRLRSVVADKPKPMADVHGKPFLEYQIEKLVGFGVTDVVLCVGYLASQIQSYFGTGSRWGTRIAYAVEQQPLGTAGAIRNARHLVPETFLVLNGDSHLGVDIADLVQSHLSHTSADPTCVATIACVPVPNAEGYGVLDIAPDTRIVGFREKAQTGAASVNGGVYVMERSFLDGVSPNTAVSLETQAFPQAIARGNSLYAYTAPCDLLDIGTPAGYQRLKVWMAEHRV